jgi:hypothetical protein
VKAKAEPLGTAYVIATKKWLKKAFERISRDGIAAVGHCDFENASMI